MEKLFFTICLVLIFVGFIFVIPTHQAFAGLPFPLVLPNSTSIIFDKESYQIEDGGFVIVTDPTANTNPSTIDTVSVSLSSTSDPVGFTTILNETGIDTGIFTNSNLITFTASSTDGPTSQLHVTFGDVMTAKYLAIQTTATAGTTPAGAGVPPSLTDPIRFDSDAFYTETRTAITVTDSSRAGTITAPATITIHVSDTNISGSGFDIQLMETPGGSGIFVTPNMLTLSNLSPADSSDPTNPILHVNVNDKIRVVDPVTTNSAEATIEPTPTALQLIGTQPNFGTAINCATDLGVTDTDKDGICDTWETSSGLVIPLNGVTYTYPCSPLLDDSQTPYHATDGTNPPVCPIANANHKDIYVEVDYMTNHKPSDDALWSVIQAFKAKNIFLHIIVDEDIGFHQDSIPYFTPNPIPTPYDNHDFQTQKTIHFGTVSDRTCPATLPPGIPDCATYQSNLLTAKRQVFHYAMFIHDMTETPTSSGFGEIGGNDFVVSLGEFAGHVGSTTQQAGTFMHELGHNLNLRHGGFEDLNCKPNYPSMMSYAYQFPFSAGGFVPDTSWVMDYSRAKYSTIYQSSLSESTPALNTISGIPTRTTVVGGILASSTPLTPQTVSTGVGVDWDQDGPGGPTNYSQNVDFNKAILDCQTDRGTTASLVSNNDWTTMALNFRPFGSFATGLSTNPVTENEYNLTAESAILSITGAPAPVADAASAAPTLNLVTSSVTMNPGDTFTRSGSFVDYDSSSWTATVDYGDGSGTQSLPLADKTFSLNHVYTNSGTYHVTVTITNDRGGVATGIITTHVGGGDMWWLLALVIAIVMIAIVIAVALLMS